VELYEKKLQIELLVKIAVAANESTCLEDALRFALTLSILSPKTDDKREGKIMEANEPLWNMSKTLEQLGGDEMLLQEVMDIFLEEAPKHLAALRLAVTQGVAETVETAAHTLKGELGYLGIPEISQRASQIEETSAVPRHFFRNSKLMSAVCSLRYAVRRPCPGTARDLYTSFLSGPHVCFRRPISLVMPFRRSL